MIGWPPTEPMLHLMKLAVGIRDVTHLRDVQAARLQTDAPLRHRTRNRPRRAAEILAGGSMYWVIAGAMVVRQAITGIVADHWEDGSACAGILLDPTLVPVAGRAVRAFQGWRYLNPEAAPADLSRDGRVSGEAELPPQMREELRRLGLL